MLSLLTLAAVCPCPPWFANHTKWGTYDWQDSDPAKRPICNEGDPRPMDYGTQVNILRTEKHFFVIND